MRAAPFDDRCGSIRPTAPVRARTRPGLRVAAPRDATAALHALVPSPGEGCVNAIAAHDGTLGARGRMRGTPGRTLAGSAGVSNHRTGLGSQAVTAPIIAEAWA